MNLLTSVTQINLIIKKKKILDAVIISHNRDKKPSSLKARTPWELQSPSAEGAIQSSGCGDQGGHSTIKVKVGVVAVKDSRVKRIV